MSILIKNANIVTQNKKREIIKGNILVENNRISNISKNPILTEADFKLDCKNNIVLPGLINTHTHIPMTLLRGYSDDLDLNRWLNESIWPVESKLNKKSIEVGTKLGILEMISSGTTTYLDMYFFEDVIGNVSSQIGIRAYLGFAMIDSGTPEYSSQNLLLNCEKFVKRWKNQDLIQPVIAPHAVYTCGPELLEKSKDISNKYDVLLHTHCSETRNEIYNVEKRYGVRPVEQLEKYGLINNKMILAHCGWITKNEISVIKKYDAKVSHCPISNMKIGTGGFAPIPEMLDSNIKVGLGTDGAASNNNLDMFDTMKFCALIHKQHRWDPEILPAQSVLDFSTIDGAATLKRESDLGSIEIGKKADLVIIDINKPHLIPNHNYISNIVYAANGNDVDTTIINGKPIMLEKEFIDIDKLKIMDDAEKYAKNLTSDL
jgi:5-methylthioadenosine/S-adenosylhomocysteine deaminase